MFFHQNEVVSRQRNGLIELVDGSGNVTTKPCNVSSSFHRADPPVVPDAVDFPSREKSFVVELQRRRLQSLRDHRRRSTAGRKTSPDRAPSPRAAKGIAAALAGLPADLQALALSKLSKKKGSR